MENQLYGILNPFNFNWMLTGLNKHIALSNSLNKISDTFSTFSSEIPRYELDSTLVHLHISSHNQLFVAVYVNTAEKTNIKKFNTSFSPLIPLANTITVKTKYLLVVLAAVVGFKCAFVVIVGVFKRMSQLQQPEIGN